MKNLLPKFILCLTLLGIPQLLSAHVFGTNPVEDSCFVQADFSISTDSCKVYHFTDLSMPVSPAAIIGWSWDFGDGNSSSLQNPSHIYASNGFFLVTLTITAVSGTDTCQSSASHLTSPNCDSCAVHADYAMAPFRGDSCKWLFIDQNTGWGYTQVVGWNWSFGDGGTSSTSTAIHTYSSPGNYTVCLTVTALNGKDTCYHTFCDSIWVNCYPCELDADFSITLGNDSCQVDFTNNSSSLYGTQITGYLWNFGDGSTSTAYAPTHYYPGNGNYTACLTVFGTNRGDSCQHTFCDTILVQCDSCELNPGIGTSFYEDSCRVDIYSATSGINGTTITGYYWDFGDGTTSTSASNVHYFPGSGTYPVCLTVYALNGIDTCQTTICDTLTVSCDSCDLLVDFNGNFSPDSCKVDFTDFTITGSGTQIISWQWTFGDGGTSSQQNPTHFYAGSGIYGVTLTVTAVAAFDTCQQTYTDTLDLTCDPLDCTLDADFSYIQTDSCSWVFTDLSTVLPAGSISNWFWDFGDGNSSTAQNPVHTYASSGVYQVCLTIQGINGSGPCPDDVYCVTITDNCVEGGRFAKETEVKWNLAPNPVGQELQIIGNVDGAYIHSVRILDIYGRKVLERNLIPDKMKMDVSQLVDGIYFLQVDGLLVGRFVKLK